jgi:hypothetical protein
MIKAPWTRMKGGLKPNGHDRPKTPPARVRPRSRAMERRMAIYRKAAEIFLRRNPRCAVYPKLKATQVHHVRGRAGSLLMDERFWLPASARGHDRIHRQPNEARNRGWLASRGDWGKAE